MLEPSMREIQTPDERTSRPAFWRCMIRCKIGSRLSPKQPKHRETAWIGVEDDEDRRAEPLSAVRFRPAPPFFCLRQTSCLFEISCGIPFVLNVSKTSIGQRHSQFWLFVRPRKLQKPQEWA